MYSEHGIAGVDAPGVRTRVPAVDRRIVLHARIAAAPGGLGHLREHLPRRIARPGLARIGHPVGGPRLVAFHRTHEVVADADRKIGVLEEHRVVGLLRVVALLDQHADLLLLAVFALDELHHVGVPVLDRLHLGGPAGLAAALDHRRDLVVHPHERQRARRLPPARKLLAVRPQRRKIGARARAELEEHRFAAGQLHDVFHVVLHALDEARRSLGILVRVLRLNGVGRVLVPVPVAHRPLDAVLVIQAHVEPNRRIERRTLVQTQPAQLAVETLAVGRRGEVTVRDAPIGDGAADAVHQLADALLALFGAHLAVEILVGHHVRGQLAPGGRDFAIGLLEEHLAPFALDGGRAKLPLDRGKRVGAVVGTEHGGNRKPCDGRLGGFRRRVVGRHDRRPGGFAFGLVHG